MNIPTKTLRTGFSMPILGLGTWQMGGREERNLDNDDARDITAIQTAIELGMTHIDTAESYASGHAETLVGQAIQDFPRQNLFLVSKVHRDHLSYEQLLTSCRASLERLRTDYLDLFLIHAPSETVPMSESFRALDTLVSEGIVKHIGVSNFSTARLKAAQTLTAHPIVMNQVYYNLLFREPEHEGLLAYCQEHDVFLEAYRPLEKAGLLRSVPAILTHMAQKYDKTPAQIAINWLTSQSQVVTLVKTSSIDHLQENLGAVGWQMAPTDIEILRHEFPDQQPKSEHLHLR